MSRKAIVIGATSGIGKELVYALHQNNYIVGATGRSHLVGISSIGAIRGGAVPAYNASKAFVSNYLQGLRHVAAKQGHEITITEIQSGFVDTQMAKGSGLFWVASPSKAANQIYSAILRKRKHAYVTKRWRIIAYLLKILPDWIYHKL